MLKSLFLTAILVVSLTLFVAQPTFSSPQFPKTQLIAETVMNSSLPQEEFESKDAARTELKDTAKGNPNQLNCNDKTANGSQAGLDSSCEKIEAVTTPRSTYPQPPHPYDTDAIKKFNQELYGAGN